MSFLCFSVFESELRFNKISFFTTYVICVALRFSPNFMLLNEGK